MFGHVRPKSLSSSRFRPHVPFSTRALLFRFLICSIVVRAAVNITVDDGDQAIVYSPGGAWRRSAQSPLNYGGSHMLAQDAGATAVFSFIGTAIYFLAPLWPYNVTTAVSLDSLPPLPIDLIDHSRPDTGGGPETVPYQVVWSATDLPNTQHTLRMSVVSGGVWAIVDGLVYTSSSELSTSSRDIDPSASSKSSIGPTSSGAAVPTPTTRPPPSRATPIALGTLLGILGIIIILIALWYIFRKRRRSDSKALSAGVSTFAGGDGAGGSYANGHEHGYSYSTPSSYSYSQVRSASGQWPYPEYLQYASGAYDPPLPPPYPGNQPNGAPNQYQSGYTLSTFTENNMPQMAPGAPFCDAPLANSLQSELGYYTVTAPGSSIGRYSPVPGPGQLGPSSDSQPQQIQWKGAGSSPRKGQGDRKRS